MKVQQFQSRFKPSNLDASTLLDVQRSKFCFANGFIIAEIMLSLSRTLNRGQLNLDRFEFWQPTS
ncbi:TPA: DUF645 family protein, partial [Vibrio cholerae]|nr:DUF645 family protein [Vibrio cholerae]